MYLLIVMIITKIFYFRAHSPGVSGVLCSDQQGLCMGGKFN